MGSLIKMRKFDISQLLLWFLFYGLMNSAFADQGRNQGAVNNLCQNLTVACQQGDKSSCKAAQQTGCMCDKKSGTCARGNYSNNKG